MNNHKLIPVTHVKYLGGIIDEHLTWNQHVKQLIKKLSSAVGILSKLRHYANKKICLNVYYAIFHWHIIYGSLVWQYTSNENLNALFALQKICIKPINFHYLWTAQDQFFCFLKYQPFMTCCF